jgi:hypothetical protein
MREFSNVANSSTWCVNQHNFLIDVQYMHLQTVTLTSSIYQMLVIQLNDNSRFEHMVVPREGLKPRPRGVIVRDKAVCQPRALY